MKFQNVSLDYCFRYASRMNAENYMMNGPKKALDFQCGAMIAWLDVQNKRAYVVKYLRTRTFKAVDSLSLSASDWLLISKLNLEHVTPLEKGVTVGNFMAHVRECLASDSLDLNDSYSVSQSDSVSHSDFVPSKVYDDYGSSQSMNFASIIQSTAQQLRLVAGHQEVNDALYILFGAKVQQLNGYDLEIDELLSQLPDSAPDQLLTVDLVHDVTKVLSAADLKLFKTSFLYHQVVLGKNVSDSWHAALVDCPTMRDELTEKINDRISQEMAKRKLSSKVTVQRVLNHLVSAA